MEQTELIVVKVTTKKSDVPIRTIIQSLERSFGKQNVLSAKTKPNEINGYHCFIEVVVPIKED